MRAEYGRVIHALRPISPYVYTTGLETKLACRPRRFFSEIRSGEFQYSLCQYIRIGGLHGRQRHSEMFY